MVEGEDKGDEVVLFYLVFEVFVRYWGGCSFFLVYIIYDNK